MSRKLSDLAKATFKIGQGAPVGTQRQPYATFRPGQPPPSIEDHPLSKIVTQAITTWIARDPRIVKCDDRGSWHYDKQFPERGLVINIACMNDKDSRICSIQVNQKGEIFPAYRAGYEIEEKSLNAGKEPSDGK